MTTTQKAALGDVTIRDLRLDDYQAVTDLWTAAGLPFRPLGRDSVVKMALELTRGAAVFLVAEADRQLVGVVLGTHDGRKGWINRLAVADAYRHRGIAARLVQEVEERLSIMGIEVVATLVESSNDDSLAFFRALGYLHDPEIEYLSKRSSDES